MRVYTKFVNLDFIIGSMSREGNNLLIRSDTSRSMPAEVVMTPQDAVNLIRVALNPSALSFLLSLPYLYFKTRRAQPDNDEDE